MPEANSAPILSNLPSRYPRIAPASAQKAKPLKPLREALRSRHYGRRTEQSYCHWVKRFIFFDTKRHPADMAEQGINAFLTHVDFHTENGAGVICRQDANYGVLSRNHIIHS